VIRVIGILAIGVTVAPAFARQATTSPLRVAATTSTIASVVQAVGGDDVVVSVLDHESGKTSPEQLSRTLTQSQLLVLNGDRAEAEWLVPRMEKGPNALRPGGRGYLDASRLGSPVDCAPSELLDPMRGLALASAIRDRLEALRPARRTAFTEGFETFRARLSVALLGERLGTKYPIEKIADLHRLGTLERFLTAQREATLLGGWFGRLRGRQGTKAVADRKAWGCFASRFGLDIVAVWETSGKAGSGPWKKEGVGIALAGVRGGAGGLEAAAKRGRVPLARLAGDLGALPGAESYVALIDFDVQAVARALEPALRRLPKKTP
jgi:hypothetical protein